MRRTLSTLSQGPWRSDRTMSLIDASEDSTPSTAPMETLIDGDDKAREIRLASTPLSSSAAWAFPQRARKAINTKVFIRNRSCAITPKGAAFRMAPNSTDLILRSRAKRGVSKDNPVQPRLRLLERPSRPLRGASGQGRGSHAAPSEGLPDADIDGDRAVAGASLEGKGDVKADGADGRIVPQPETGRREQRLVEVGEVR